MYVHLRFVSRNTLADPALLQQFLPLSFAKMNED